MDSLTSLKARRIVRADFIDELTSRHLADHAGYYGTMVWVLMMLEQWFAQSDGYGRRGSGQGPAAISASGDLEPAHTSPQ